MTAAKLLFAGTPEFALESLRALHQAGHVPAAVLTQPDRPAGRGKKMTQSPVKQFAREHDIPVWQPETLKDAEIVKKISEIEADLMIVAAYGLLLPQAVLDLPVRGCVNVHASLLPRWRGASPIQAAIIEGDAETGVTLMQMEAGLDSGPLLASAAIEIGAEETAATLHDRLAALGGELLVQQACGNSAGRCVGHLCRQDSQTGCSDRLGADCGTNIEKNQGLRSGSRGQLRAGRRGRQVLESRASRGRRRSLRGHIVSRQRRRGGCLCRGVTAAEFAGQTRLGGKRLH
jgi:methionyl-tRNA formyltransferase